ncbi:MAG: NCS2 family permease [Spirochaetia bacterium]|jgi:AGZA family xanthine/uracil permease-like MFS transporter|nr:NCS2 family permease [Spirochaetia bacterium]
MEGFLENVLTALAVVVNGIPQGLLALTYGFAAFPTAIAFVIGIIGSLMFNSVATISFQAETITLAGTLGSNIKERLSLVFWGGFLLLIPSILGVNEAIVRFIGPVIMFSMMAGVGIMLANVSMELLKSEKISGTVSLVTGLIVWFIKKDLAWTIIVSVAVSTAFYILMRYNKPLREKYKINLDTPHVDTSLEKFHFGNIEWKFWKNRTIVLGALSIACLNIGANISFGKITGSIAGVNTNIDHLAIYSSLADMGSTLLGGAPVEAIISGTATAPNPLLASVLMMGIMAVILLMKLLPVIGKFVHKSSITGFLFVLGAFVTFATNISDALGNAGTFAGPFGFGPMGMIIGATVFVTARFNPFFGMLAGIIVKLVFFGL